MKIITIFLTLIAITLDFTPQIVEIESRIAELEARSAQLKYKRCRKNDVFKGDSKQQIPKQQVSLFFTQVCHFNQTNLQSFFIQSIADIYLVVNYETSNRVKIYNSQCLELSTLQNIQITSVLVDRGQIQSGLSYVIGKDQYLYSLHEDTGFKNMTKIASVAAQAQIVGGIVRYRGKEKADIFIVYRDGAVKIFQQSGNKKLAFSLGNSKTQIQKLIDRHPYPIASTNSDWLLLLDTTKYSQIQQNCPHIPNIKAILTQSQYNEIIYILTSEKIYAVSLEHNKRQCSIKHEYSFDNSLSKISKVSFFGHSIFIDDKVYNLTQKKLYRSDECQNQTHYQFMMKKNHPDQNYYLKKCCKNNQCNLSYGKLNKKLQDRRIFLWLSIVFVLILFVSLSFIKKSNVSNLDIDESFQQKQRNLDRHYYQISKQQKKQKQSKAKKK